MASQVQKAIFVYKVGEPVQLGEREVPIPKVGEVLVKITSVQLLPHDAYGRDRGVSIGDKLPWVLGSSIAGVVDKVGLTAEPSYNIGDRVFGTSNLQCLTPDQAGLQEYAILQTDSIARTPKGISDDEAATLPINMATVAIALFTRFGFDFPAPWDEEFVIGSQPIIMLGAGTNIARLFARLATKVLGAKILIAVAGLSNKDELLAAGVSHVIDRHLPDEAVVEQVHAAAGGTKQVTKIIDCASWEHHLATALLAPEQPTRLVTLHRVNEAKIQEQKPMCRATLVQNTNANLVRHAQAFWMTLAGMGGRGNRASNGF